MSMTLSNKHSLAARRFVYTALIIQFISTVIGAIALSKIHQLDNGVTEPCKVCGVWWGLLKSSEKPSISFWLYYNLRTLHCVHTGCIALTHRNRYDLVKKNAEKESIISNGVADYRKIPATTFTKWIEWLPPVIVLMVDAEYMLWFLHLSKKSQWTEWGQSAILVTCLCGCFHWLCMNLELGAWRCIWWRLRRKITTPFGLYRADFVRLHPGELLFERMPSIADRDLGKVQHELFEAIKLNDIKGMRQLLLPGALSPMNGV